jgi:hypothetical protein
MGCGILHSDYICGLCGHTGSPPGLGCFDGDEWARAAETARHRLVVGELAGNPVTAAIEGDREYG